MVVFLASMAWALCGDGVLDAGETCDDANTASADGCDAACVIEAGHRCDQPISTSLQGPIDVWAPPSGEVNGPNCAPTADGLETLGLEVPVPFRWSAFALYAGNLCYDDHFGGNYSYRMHTDIWAYDADGGYAAGWTSGRTSDWNSCVTQTGFKTLVDSSGADSFYVGFIDSNCADNTGGARISFRAVSDCYPDADQDGVADVDDNCVNAPNPSQADVDADGIGDACVDPTATADAPFGGLYLAPKAVMGAGATADAGTVIGRRTTIGANSHLGQDVTIARGVTIGAGVTIEDGATIGYGAQIADGTHIGASSVIGNLATVRGTLNGKVLVGRGSVVDGATITDATIGPDVTVHEGAIIEADVKVRRGATIYRFAKLRTGSSIGREAVVGENTEVTTTGVLRAGAIVHSNETVSTLIARGAEIGSATQIRTINPTDGLVTEYGDPVCSANGISAYFAADGTNFYAAVSGVYLGGGGTPGPHFSFFLQNDDGDAGVYWPYEFPNAGTGDGWTYGATMFDANNICRYLFGSPGNCTQVGFDPQWTGHYAGKAGFNQASELTFPRGAAGAYGSGSGTARFGIVVHQNVGSDHEILFACSGTNPTGFSSDTNKLDWTTWATAPYPTYLP